MKMQGIRADELTYSTLIKGCLANQQFRLVVELMKDAIDQGLNLPNDLGTTILNDLNRWRTDD